MRAVRRFLVLLAVLSAAPLEHAAATGLDRCDARVTRAPDEYRSYACYWSEAARSGQWHEAARRLDAILAVSPSNHLAGVALAQVEASRGRDRAEPLFRAAAAAFGSAGEWSSEVYARLGLAFFLGERGRWDDARAELERAAGAAERSADRILIARVLTRQASQANREEDFGRGLRLLRTVEPDVFPDGPPDLQQIWFSYMAYSCWALGRLEEALDYYDREAELLRARGAAFDEAVPRRNIAFIAGRLGLDRKRRKELALAALDAAVRGGNRSIESSARYDLSFVTEGQERIEHARRSLEIARELKTFANLQMGLRGVAASLIEVDPEQAFERIEEAIALARRHGSSGDVARDSLIRARMRWTSGPRDEAIADSLAALNAIEAVRNLQPDSNVRARTFSTWRGFYYELASRLLSLDGTSWTPASDDLDRALRVIERQRARTLLDALDGARAAGVLAPVGPVAQRRAAVLLEIVDVQRRLLGPGLVDAARDATLLELERLETEEAELRDELARSDASFAALRQPGFPSLERLRAALDTDQALLSFQLPAGMGSDEAEPWLLVLTRDDARVYPVPDAATLDHAIRLFRGLFDRRDGTETGAAMQLHRDLVGTALSDLPQQVDRLVVVPDGPLHFLPFGALRAAPTGDPLALLYRISIVPSATAWLRWSEGAPPATERPALVIADPRFVGGEPRDAPEGPRERSSSLARSLRLGPLPHAREEGRSILRSLGSGSRLLAGEQATERRIKQTPLARFGVLHFAVHALVDDVHPDRSAILLAPGADDEDGLLQIREIVELDLAADQAVVLSACRSASGVVIGGEGVLGLARAFFQAGAGTVVGSLWPLRDDEAAALFESFYRHLGRGATLGAALREAQRERIRTGAPAASWAGLVVLGNGDVAPVRGAPRRWLPLAAAALLLALGVVAVRRWRRRRSRDAYSAARV